jgi:hypothetical protein
LMTRVTELSNRTTPSRQTRGTTEDAFLDALIGASGKGNIDQSPVMFSAFN